MAIVKGIPESPFPIPDVSQGATFLEQNPGFEVPNLGKEYPGLSHVPNIFGKKPGQLLTGDKIQVEENTSIPNLNPAALEKLAVQAAELGYNLSDEDFAKRFPLLVKGREANIASAAANLAGKPDPFVAATLKKSGLGDLKFGTNAFAQARNMGVPILSKEQRDRNYFTRLLSDNPARAFGLNAKDIEAIALANTQGINMNAMGVASANAAQAVADAQSAAANNAALMSAIGQIGSAGVKGGFDYYASRQSPTLAPQYYTPPGYNPDPWNPYSGNFYSPSGQYSGNIYGG